MSSSLVHVTVVPLGTSARPGWNWNSWTLMAGGDADSARRPRPIGTPGTPGAISASAAATVSEWSERLFIPASPTRPARSRSGRSGHSALPRATRGRIARPGFFGDRRRRLTDRAPTPMVRRVEAFGSPAGGRRGGPALVDLLRRSLLALLVVVAGAVWSSAGAAAATIAGVIQDADQRPLPGARVRVDTADGGLAAVTTADDEGRFAVSGLAEGTYTLSAEAEGYDRATEVVTVSGTEETRTSLTLTPTAAVTRLPPAVVVAPRFTVPPDIGAPTYEITKESIKNQPGGENNSLSQILLRAPGVAQDGSLEGAIHVRNQMGNLQYRINGVTLPEGATLFSQSGGLSTRMVSSVTLLTGTLPAEYGLRTTGIFDVQTKSGAFDAGGYLAMYGGSQSWIQPSFEYGGTAGRLSYFIGADYLQNSIGISPATPGGAIHDGTRQGHGFGYFEYRLDASSRLTLVAGTFAGHFQIPNSPGATPSFVVDGVTEFDSTQINENQMEQNQFAVISYRRADGPLDVQSSVYASYSSLAFRPDPLADLLFNGISQTVNRSSLATGWQTDVGYDLTPTHTLRAGVLFAAEQTSVQTTSLVLPATNGVQTSDQPYSVFDSTGKTGYTYSVYVQDTWRL